MRIESYYFPLEPSDMAALENVVRVADPFTASSIPDAPADVYEVLAFRRQANNYGTESVVLADRNLVSRWIAIVEGRRITDSHRTAAAVMAFAQCANMMIEPNLALYEVAATSGSDAANAELSTFRVADNVAVDTWAEIALGRRAALSPEDIERARSSRRGPPNLSISICPFVGATRDASIDPTCHIGSTRS